MAKKFINGGDVDKIKITNTADGGKVEIRVTGDTKAKRAAVELEVDIEHTDDKRVECIIKKFEIGRGKDRCTGFCKIEVPYEVSNAKVLSGTVKKID